MDRTGYSGRVWRFGQCEFDEFSRELKVKGEPVELESKPIEVLYQLLLHAGEVVSKDELMETVWPGTSVVEGSLATAVSKLRKALGGDESGVVLTVPRIGYRLGVPAQCRQIAAPPTQDLFLEPGDPIPGRENWLAVRNLDETLASEVWLAENPKTHEFRVFKFASDGVRLQGIKREVTLFRILKESLGDRSDFVRILEWNFDQPPFSIESEYCGTHLGEWAEQEGGLAAVPLAARLKLLIEVGRAVAAAHSVGVLHKDLKPGNILVTPGVDGGWQVKVADFGSGSLMEPSRLRELGITNLGFTRTSSDLDQLTGTMMYLAPEVLAGQSPTALADVYCLGVVLYQLVIGDLRRPLSPGWEAGVDDPLLREDIAEAACGDPTRRTGSVATLVRRLEMLESRRALRGELEKARNRAAKAEQRLARTKAQRPWIIAAVLALTAGLAASVALYRKASDERDRANRQTAIAAAINRFLGEDLLGRSDPFQSGNSSESLIDAVKLASPNIDLQFHDLPLVAARLHHSIARALDSRTDYADARKEYDKIAQLFDRAGAADDAIEVQLQLASMEARSYEGGSLPRARSILAAQEVRIAKLAKPRDDLAIWLASARGMIALVGNDVKAASTEFQKAYDGSKARADIDENTRLAMKERLAFCSIRLGDGAKAEQLAHELISEFTRLRGPDSPNVLRARLNLAQAFMIEAKYQDGIKEANAIYPLYIARLGEEHALTMQLVSTRAQCEGSMERWDDAIRDDLKIHQLAVAKQGAGSFYAVASLSDTALAQCRGGHYVEGERNAREAYDLAVKAFGLKTGLAGGTADTLAGCLIGLDRLDEAEHLLDGIDAKAVAQLTGVKDWSTNLARAEIALKRNDYAVAHMFLDAAKPMIARADTEPYLKKKAASIEATLNHQETRTLRATPASSRN